MRKLTLLLALVCGSALAAPWKKISADGIGVNTYYAPGTGPFAFELVLQLSEAAPTEAAITLASYRLEKDKSIKYISCQRYIYTGEMQETFTFISQTNIQSVQDDVGRINIEILNEAKTPEEKAISAAIACSDTHREGIAVYVPSRFAELALPSLFGDTRLKLSRLYGAAIRPELP